jgi:hypothetical protein
VHEEKHEKKTSENPNLRKRKKEKRKKKKLARLERQKSR